MDKKEKIQVEATPFRDIPRGWNLRFFEDIIVATHPAHLSKTIGIVDAEHVPFAEWPR